jgi:nucleoside-diphosphate-sugar epimerase
MKKRRALVTGGTGFIGSHLVKRLAGEGWDVHLIVRQTSGRSLPAELKGEVTFHVHDGSTEGLIRTIQNVQPDTVFHLASLFLSQHTPKDIEPLIRSNVLFPAQMIEAMVLSGVHRFVNTGTSWQHFESKSYSPVNLYAATKQAFEAVLQYYVETSPLRVITLKLSDTYGPNDTRPKLFNLLRNAARSQQTLMMSPGDQLIDIVYIDDVLDAYMIAAERLLCGKVERHEMYAVSSGSPVPLKDLVALYARVVGKNVPVEWGAKPYRPREVMRPWNKGMLLSGWQPKTTIQEGIKKMEEMKE